MLYKDITYLLLVHFLNDYFILYYYCILKSELSFILLKHNE